MEEKLQFFYKEEFWYISAMINCEEIKVETKSAEIEKLLTEKLRNLTENDLQSIKEDQKLIEQVIDLGRHISLKCEWVPFIDHFPFFNENLGLEYNILGYLKFKVDYYKENLSKREMITPPLIQPIAIAALNILKKFCARYENQYLFLDLESPIYIFATSDTIKDEMQKEIEVSWTEGNILKFRRVLGYWTIIYSGQWADYSDEVYTKRVQNNLSNRLSELHFIHRNSGFIYMVKENYVKHFERYMMRTVLEPTAQVRSMLFALMAINESLDILFAMKDFISIKNIEEKIESLRNTRGLLQTKMSLIYNEVDYNRREHSTSVLTHLITQFNLKGIIERIHTKFNVLSDSMELRYQKANRENQARTEHGMTYLNILFSLAAIIQVLAFVFTEDQPLVTGFSTVFLVVISAILILVLKSFFSMKRGEKKANIRKTVDAVILDPEQENVVLIKRRWPPFKGQWALPGGFIEKSDKSPQEAVTREIEEETGLKLKIEGQIGIYGNPNRDPRGRVITTAFFCSIIGSKELRCSGESTELKFIPLKDLEGINLAFDHEFILKDAIEKFLQKALRS